jgi:hypothetical protein
MTSGTNPAIVSYNSSAAKIYSATSSLVRFESKNISFYFENMLYLAYYNASVLDVNSKVVGWAPGFKVITIKIILAL